ncbi:MAG: Ig-like domain repeat protein, partial [Spirochaetales bacterium]|nr:Ig-like domain repeat protein [Spirochaetales bacterium]
AYKADDVIKIQVIFTENVDISIPDGKQLAMKLNIAGNERYAVYDGSEDGNSHNKAVFVYTVQKGDNVDVLSWTSWVADGVEITDSAVGAGGKGNAFAFSQTDTIYQWSSKLVIDTTAPQVSEVFSSFSSPKLELEGCYDETEKAYYCNAGKMITLTVAFSENVRVSDDSSLSLNLKGNNTTTAKYSSGSGTKNLTFSYTVVDGDSTEKDETLKVTVISGNITDNAGNRLLGINGSMTIRDGSGNEKKLIIDTTAPAAPVITASKNPNATDLVSNKDIYTEMKEGKTVGVTLKGTYTDSDIYSCCWVENGVAENFDTVSSEIVKTFGDGESEGFYQEYSIQLKLKDKAGNVSELSHPKVFIIDTDKPELTRASSSTVVNGELKTSVTRKYTEGEQIYISLVFNKHVTATDVIVKLNNGKSVSLANKTTNIEGNKDYYLTGIYKVGTNEESAENLKIDSIVSGSVKDSLNNTLELSGISLNDIENIDDSQEIKIDSKAPYITEISSSKSNGWYTVGAIIPITVKFSESVELIDTPTLKLSLANGKTAIASYVSGSGKNSWIFNYEVKNGENTGDSSKDLSYLKAASITGEIRDLAGTIKNGNRLVETIPAENFAGKKIGIDTTAPAALILKGVLSKKTEGGEVVEVGVENGKSYGGNKGTDFVTVSCNGGQESGAVFYVTKNGEVCGDWGDTFGSVQCKPDNGEILTYTINAKQRDKAGNISPEASITFTIDNSHPALESITTTHPNGTCTTGARIPLILKFNKRVEVTGTISVTLNAEDKSGNP